VAVGVAAVGTRFLNNQLHPPFRLEIPEIYSDLCRNFPWKLLNGFIVLNVMNKISGAIIVIITNWTFQKLFL